MSEQTIAAVPNVLVVEDEMVLRMKAIDIVEDAGFTAIEAVNADEAMTILESRSDISLLFTDIQMPGSLDGLKLAHAVHRRWPGRIQIVADQFGGDLLQHSAQPGNRDRPRHRPAPLPQDAPRRAGIVACPRQMQRVAQSAATK